MIRLVNVGKIYGKGEGAVHALSDVNLTIEDGTFISIVGKSGSGKSTMMNIIGALDKPTSGEVFANGKDITKLPDKKLAEYRNKHIGYVFQSFYLEPTFTVLENVAMPLTIAGVDREKREAAARWAINQLGLDDKADKLASQLSGGQKQRVSIARAIVHGPSAILADEPTGNLDSQNGADVIKLLQYIADSGKTVVLVTHNFEDARKTDMMVELKDGKIQRITHNTAEQKAAAQKAHDYDEQGKLKHRKEENVVPQKPAASAPAPVQQQQPVQQQPPVQPAPAADIGREPWEPPAGSPPFLTGFAYNKGGKAFYVDAGGIEHPVKQYDAKLKMVTLANGHKYKLKEI